MSALQPPLPTSQPATASEIWSRTDAVQEASVPSDSFSQADLDAYLDRPLVSGQGLFPGTEGLMLRDIEQDILKGGRFVIHHYCISVMIMTFTRSSDIYYLRSSKSGVSRAAGYSILSLLLGWWGIPFGFIFTPYVLWKNGRGGTDVTREVMAQIVGPSRSESILAKAAPRRISGLHWALFSACLGLPAVLIYTVFSSAK